MRQICNVTFGDKKIFRKGTNKLGAMHVQSIQRYLRTLPVLVELDAEEMWQHNVLTWPAFLERSRCASPASYASYNNSSRITWSCDQSYTTMYKVVAELFSCLSRHLHRYRYLLQLTVMPHPFRTGLLYSFPSASVSANIWCYAMASESSSLIPPINGMFATTVLPCAIAVVNETPPNK